MARYGQVHKKVVKEVRTCAEQKHAPVFEERRRCPLKLHETLFTGSLQFFRGYAGIIFPVRFVRESVFTAANLADFGRLCLVVVC